MAPLRHRLREWPGKPRLPLYVRNRFEKPVELSFLVDTGSDYSIIPIEWVAEYQLATVDVEESYRTYRTSGSSESFSLRGKLDFSFDPKFRKTFRWPCHFSFPSTVTIQNVDRVVEKFHADGFESIEPSGSMPRRFANDQANRFHTPTKSYGQWLHRTFPSTSLRYGLLGRMGFLADFELRLTLNHLVIAPRNPIRDSWRNWRTR
jgi:hypothetical protein